MNVGPPDATSYSCFVSNWPSFATAVLVLSMAVRRQCANPRNGEQAEFYSELDGI